MVEERFPLSGLSTEYGDIILSSVVSDIILDVVFAGVSILSERYTPDSDGLVFIRDIGKLAESYFPVIATSMTNGLDGESILFSITLTEGSTTISKTIRVFRSDVDSSSTLTDDELQKKPLCRLSKKVTGIGCKEFVSFYSGAPVKVDACFISTAQDELVTFTLADVAADNKFYRYDISPEAIAILAGIDVENLIYYNVYSDASDIVKLIMDVRPVTPTDILVFKNSFGAQEVFNCLGDKTSERKWERELGSIKTFQRQIYKRLVRTFTINTGYVNTQSLEALEDLLNSESISILENGILLPIVILEETFKETSRKDDLISVEFKYRLATTAQLQYRHNPLAKMGVFDQTFDETYE